MNLSRASVDVTAAALAVIGSLSIAIVQSADAAPPISPYTTSASRYWWKVPIVHTTQEIIFLAWMEAQFGEDFLEWMPDPAIAECWRQFVEYSWSA